MTTFVIILHVLACLCLIFIVLLQTGKGSEMGAIFGSASSSVFGPTGPTTILTKITIGAAIVFMLTSFYLTYSFSRPLSNTIVPKSKTPAQSQQQQQNQPIQQQQNQPTK
ncbi:MAG: preprotein translocase subunit SecG [Proteobacteria bacterium]|nr:preprotein translocase subunit SecG [Pseudomonadota bacterium]